MSPAAQDRPCNRPNPRPMYRRPQLLLWSIFFLLLIIFSCKPSKPYRSSPCITVVPEARHMLQPQGTGSRMLLGLSVPTYQRHVAQTNYTKEAFRRQKFCRLLTFLLWILYTDDAHCPAQSRFVQVKQASEARSTRQLQKELLNQD